MHLHKLRNFMRRALLGLGLLAGLSLCSEVWGQQPKPDEVAAKAQDGLRREFPFSKARISPAAGDRYKVDATALDDNERQAIMKAALAELGLVNGDKDKVQFNIGLFQAKPTEIKPEYVIAEGELLILTSKTGLPIKRVVVPRASVINADPDPTDPTQIRITGRAQGTTPLTMTDVRDNVTVTSVRVERDLTDLREAVRREYPRANVKINPGQGQMVIVTGTVDSSEEVEGLLRFIGGYAGGAANVINALRVDGVMQVALEVCIAQVDRNEERRIGFDFFFDEPGKVSILSRVAAITSIQQSSDFGTTLQLDPTRLTQVVSITDNGKLFDAFIDALRVEGVAKTLANPTLTALSGRSASFLLGGEIPVIEATATGTPSISFKQFGTILNFIPVILGDGRIRIQVFAEVSQPNFAVTVLGTPTFTTTNTSTVVELQAGQTMAIGGLLQTIVNATATKTPVLGDLPFVGAAFRRTFHTEKETELLIIVTPRLVDGLDCGQRTVKLPGQESRSPTDFELFLEGILEAPRGAREICPDGCYRPAHLGDLTSQCGTVGPCGKGLTTGHKAGSNGKRPVAASAIPSSHRMAPVQHPAAMGTQAPVMQVVPPAPALRVEYRQAEQPGVNAQVRPPEPPAEVEMPASPDSDEPEERDDRDRDQ